MTLPSCFQPASLNSPPHSPTLRSSQVWPYLWACQINSHNPGTQARSTLMRIRLILLLLLLFSFVLFCLFEILQSECSRILLLVAFICSRADSLRSLVILHEWLAFYSAFWISTEMVCLHRWHGWCHVKLLLSQCTFCVYNHAPYHFIQSHIRKVHASL